MFVWGGNDVNGALKCIHRTMQPSFLEIKSILDDLAHHNLYPDAGSSGPFM